MAAIGPRASVHRRKIPVMRRPPNAAALAGLAAARDALAHAPALLGDAGQAERDRLRLEDEARQAAQGVLPLGQGSA